ncbi:T9SS C-terminal target domain-containing protein [Zobellia amurskyensis]|uniref:T9SS C-terminal target domain-containing protein n=1 Tax=Zobellia amurskyensis TaxID=248905 RepID=A0A7X2ZVQ1_9FLAO|nr:T9SS type A sorting domain-containing protein [Zobellia amurskyensis]MUH37277.1 T9SS C-terminal target domain-containing protein [Zobellia amurskyensis]
MKRKLLLFFLSVSATFSFAQSIERSVVSNVGGTMTGADISVSFTIGEPIVGLVAENNSVDQGFWAGKGILVIPLSPGEEPSSILVYPNPVIEEVTVFTGQNKVFGIELFAVNGQRILNQKVEASQLEYKIDMAYMAKGVYVLKLYLEGNTESKAYKLIKE